MAVDVGSAVGYLDLDIGGFLDGWRNAQKIVQENTKKFEDSLKDLGKNLTDVGKIISLYFSAPIGGALAFAGKAAIDFESAFAGVRKTVDASEEEFAVLRNGIIDMSKAMPQSAVAIAGVAEAAGQLGIKTENILEFSKTMMMLGDSTNLSANDAATALARFANITSMSQQDFDKLGSVIVALGNNFATTEAEITAMGLRLAGTGETVGLTEPEIMAIAGALSSVGINAEAGGSAFSKLMKNMQVATETTGKLDEVFAAISVNGGIMSQEIEKTLANMVKAQESVTSAQEKYNAAVNKYGQDSSQAEAALIKLETAQQNLTKAQEEFYAVDRTPVVNSIRELEMLADIDPKGFKALAHDLNMTSQELKNLVDNGKDLENFAQVAGMTGEQFKKAFQEDAAGAMLAFIGGLADAERNGQSAVAVLDEMGITEIRLSDTLLRGTNAIELFHKSLDMANTAWKDGTALKEEAAKRYDTLEAKIAMVQNALTDLRIDIGERLQPYIESFLEIVNNWINWFNNLSDSTKDNIVQWGLFLAALGPILVFIGTLVSGFGSLVGILGGAAAGIAGLIGAMGIFVAPVLEVVAVLTTLGGVIYTLWWTNEEFRNEVTAIWNNIAAYFSETVSKIKDILTEMGFEFSGITSSISDVWVDFCNMFKPVIMPVLEFIQFGVTEALDFVLAFFQNFKKNFSGDWNNLWDVVSAAWTSFWETLKPCWDRFVAWIIPEIQKFGQWIFDNLPKWLTTIIEKVSSFAMTVLDNVVELLAKALHYVISNFDTIIAEIMKFAEKALVFIVKFLGDIVILLLKCLVEIVAYIAGHLDEIIIGLVKFIGILLYHIISLTGTIIVEIVQCLGVILAHIVMGLAKIIVEVVIFIGKLLWELTKGLGKIAVELIKSAVSIGKSIIEGIWNGIVSASSWFYNKLTGFFKQIPSWAKQILGINSPSKVFADVIGKAIPEGIMLGFEQGMPAMFKKLQTALDTGMGTLKSGDINFDYGLAPAKAKSGNTQYADDYFAGQQNTSGNTYNFYSPEPITEAQARRELEQLNRKMAFGF